MIKIGKSSGRAKCGQCSQPVEKGLKTVRANFGSMYVKTYHMDCFKNANWGFIHELYYENMSEAEREDLSQS